MISKQTNKCRPFYATSVFVLILSFVSSSLYIPTLRADELPFMAQPGVRVGLSPEFTPAILRGITVHPENPLKFDFIILKGDKRLSDTDKQIEYKKLIKYFMASLAVPDEDQWVNLSPYEKNRIIKDNFGQTEMGRDLLAQDYMLKQITASLIYPEDGLGKKFWDKVYALAQQQYGTTNIPVNTFNKVWILPDNALIYEKGNTAYVLKNHLKVMLEEDYLSLEKHSALSSQNASLNMSFPNASVGNPDMNDANKAHTIGSKVVREIILPQLEKEVNEGKNFANLRQVYSGMILAAWYKRALKESLLGKIYADKTKLKGIDQDPKNNEEIYHRYLKAYKKGVFNFIKEDVDEYTQQPIPRKYFSGGVENDYAMILKTTNDAGLGDSVIIQDAQRADDAVTDLEEKPVADLAMIPMKYDQVMSLNDLRTRFGQIERKVNPAIHLSDTRETGVLSLVVVYAVGLMVFPNITALSVADNGDVYLAYLRNNQPVFQRIYMSGRVRTMKVTKEKIPARIRREFGLIERPEADAAMNVQPYAHPQIDLDRELASKLDNLNYAIAKYQIAERGVQEQDQKFVNMQEFIRTIHSHLDTIIETGLHPKFVSSDRLDFQKTLSFKTTSPYLSSFLSTARSIKETAINYRGSLEGLLAGTEELINGMTEDEKKTMAEVIEEINSHITELNDLIFVINEVIPEKEQDNRLFIVLESFVNAVAAAWKPYSKEEGLRTYGKRLSERKVLSQRLSNFEIIYGATSTLNSIYYFIEKLDQAMSSKANAAMKTRQSKPNNAMITDEKGNPLGGIDFNAANLNLQIKRDGRGVPLPMTQQNLEDIKIDGLIPIIIDIKPAVDSPLMSELQVSGSQGQVKI